MSETRWDRFLDWLEINLRGGRPFGMSTTKYFGSWTPGPATIFVLAAISGSLVVLAARS